MTDYKLVPVEPTPEMLQVWKSMHGYSRYNKYKAMLAAAPQPAEQQLAPDVPGLTEALRQYQHNDGSGLVFGYDKLLVDQYVAQLVEALARCRHEASYSIGEEEALSIQLGKVRDIVNQTLSALAPYRKGGEV